MKKPNAHIMFLAHLSRRLVGELIVYPWSGVWPFVLRPASSSTISNMNISASSGPIAMKFQKHHWDGGKAAIGFGSDRIRTLVSMATDSSHRVIMEKTVSPLFLGCFSSDPFHTCRYSHRIGGNCERIVLNLFSFSIAKINVFDCQNRYNGNRKLLI